VHVRGFSTGLPNFFQYLDYFPDPSGIHSPNSYDFDKTHPISFIDFQFKLKRYVW
jgi:hypothetical protein